MYHGMLFGPDGRCRQVPGMDKIPPGANVPTLAAVEKDGWIWVWLGDPATADPALICEAVGPIPTGCSDQRDPHPDQLPAGNRQPGRSQPRVLGAWRNLWRV
jgi:phenylpropionate dioxygenase-like ring-hydroxylating dioxygenase large terminal subunit